MRTAMRKARLVGVALVTAMAIAGTAGSPALAAKAPKAPSPLPCAPLTGGKVTAANDIYPAGWVYLIYWGSYWNTKAGKVAQSNVDGLFGIIGTSPFARTITQYCDPFYGSPAVLQANELQGAVVDAATGPPSLIGDAAIQQEIVNESPIPTQGKGILPIPVVVTPPGTVDDHVGCSHHNSFMQTDNQGGFIDRPYVSLDYGSITSSASCHGPSTLQSLMVDAGHEWAEAITDPDPNPGESAWADYSALPFEEIADLCQTMAPAKYRKYWLPALWSDEAGGCVYGS